jgi:hypothetical protein
MNQEMICCGCKGAIEGDDIHLCAHCGETVHERCEVLTALGETVCSRCHERESEESTPED